MTILAARRDNHHDLFPRPRRNVHVLSLLVALGDAPPLRKKESRVLEVGCGDTPLAWDLRDAGYTGKITRCDLT